MTHGPLEPRLELTLALEASDAEVEVLRRSVDELADELAVLRLALDGRKIEILDAAETDLAWEEIARAAWPEEFAASGDGDEQTAEVPS